MMMMKIKMVTNRFIVDVPREKRRVADEVDDDEEDEDEKYSNYSRVLGGGSDLTRIIQS